MSNTQEQNKIQADYGTRTAELNLAGLVFSTYKARGWTIHELWDRLPEPVRKDIVDFVAKYPPKIDLKLNDANSPRS